MALVGKRSVWPSIILLPMVIRQTVQWFNASVFKIWAWTICLNSVSASRKQPLKYDSVNKYDQTTM